MGTEVRQRLASRIIEVHSPRGRNGKLRRGLYLDLLLDIRALF